MSEPKSTAPVPDTSHEHDPTYLDPDPSVADPNAPANSADEPTAEVSRSLAPADYDAQTDLALGGATGGARTDGFTPFAGSVDVPPDEPAYDIDRDTAS